MIHRATTSYPNPELACVTCTVHTIYSIIAVQVWMYHPAPNRLGCIMIRPFDPYRMRRSIFGTLRRRRDASVAVARRRKNMLQRRPFAATAQTTATTPRPIPPTCTAAVTDFDVLIVGGGVVGAALARQLALLSTEASSSLTIGIIEAGPGPKETAMEDFTASSSSSSSTPSIPNPRSYALSPASLDILGINEEQAQAWGGPYQSMQVWEATHPASLLWTTDDLQDETSSQPPPPFLGCCIEDSVLQQHLWRELRSMASPAQPQSSSAGASVHLMSHTKLEQLQFPASDNNGGWVTGVAVSTAKESTSSDASSSSPSNNNTLRTQLLVAADGSRSQIRTAAGIGVHRTEYGQTAVTCTVELAAPLGPRAFQRFQGRGEPLALLPTRSPRHAVVVWSTTPAQAARFTNDDSKDVVVGLWNDLLQTGPQPPPPLFPTFPTLQSIVDTAQYGGALLGTGTDGFDVPPRITRVASPQLLQFPLAWQYATTTSANSNQVVLVGDAACTVHPLAGQGLNIGLQHGVRNVTTAVQTALRAGVPLTTFLQRQQPLLPRPDMGIHAIQRLFAQEGSWAQNIKCFGLNAVQAVGPVRRALVRAACYGAV